jgi:putative copper export protein
LTLHVAAATIWVGGQYVMLGLLATLRSFGGDAAKQVARAFGRLSWPAFWVLAATGIWNVMAEHPRQPSGRWNAVLGIKVAVVVLAGLGAFIHARAKSKAGLAAWGSIAGLASTAALILGVFLAG